MAEPFQPQKIDTYAHRQQEDGDVAQDSNMDGIHAFHRLEALQANREEGRNNPYNSGRAGAASRKLKSRTGVSGFAKKSSLPYERPAVGRHASAGPQAAAKLTSAAAARSSAKKPWLSVGLVGSAASKILNGASSLLSGIFWKGATEVSVPRLLPPPVPAATQDGEEHVETERELLEEKEMSITTLVEVNNIENHNNNGEEEVEGLLKRKTLSVEEYNRIIQVLRPRVAENEHPKSQQSDDSQKDTFKVARNQRGLGGSFELPAGEADTGRWEGFIGDEDLVQDVNCSSPVDIAKAYMGRHFSSTPTFPARILNYKDALTIGRESPREQPRIIEPVSRFPRTPHSLSKPSEQMDEARQSIATPQSLKRRSDVLEDNMPSSSVRRTRQKSGPFAAGNSLDWKTSGTLTKGALIGPPLSSLSTGAPRIGNGPYYGRMRNLTMYKGKGVRKEDLVKEKLPPVPAQSSETARKILETLEKVTPSPKGKALEEELALVRARPPKELSLSMLNDQARKSMQSIKFPDICEPGPSRDNTNLDVCSKLIPEVKDVPRTMPEEKEGMSSIGVKTTTAQESRETPMSNGPICTENVKRGFRMNAAFEEYNSDDEGHNLLAQASEVKDMKQSQVEPRINFSKDIASAALIEKKHVGIPMNNEIGTSVVSTSKTQGPSDASVIAEPATLKPISPPVIEKPIFSATPSNISYTTFQNATETAVKQPATAEAEQEPVAATVNNVLAQEPVKVKVPPSGNIGTQAPPLSTPIPLQFPELTQVKASSPPIGEPKSGSESAAVESGGFMFGGHQPAAHTSSALSFGPQSGAAVSVSMKSSAAANGLEMSSARAITGQSSPVFGLSCSSAADTSETTTSPFIAMSNTTVSTANTSLFSGGFRGISPGVSGPTTLFSPSSAQAFSFSSSLTNAEKGNEAPSAATTSGSELFSVPVSASSTESAPAASNAFNVGANSASATSQSVFAFGQTSAGASSSGSSSFSFGSSANVAGSTSTSPFCFGASSTAVAPSFSFGASSGSSLSSSTAGFSFTAAPANGPSLTAFSSSGSTTSPTFSFAGTVTSAASVSTSTSPFMFGGKANGTTSSATAPFMFGAGSAATSSQFSFGTMTSGASSSAPVSTFSFGAGAGPGTSSAPSGPFSFGAASSSNGSNFMFGASAANNSSSSSFTFNSGSTTPAFGFEAKSAFQQPSVFGLSTTAPTFGASSNGPSVSEMNEQMEESMVEESPQAAQPPNQFGAQSSPAPAGFAFGAQPPSVPFGAPPVPAVPSPFGQPGDLNFSAGAFTVGSGGDKSGRRYVRPKRTGNSKRR